MKKLLPILFLLIAVNAYSAPPSRIYTYTAGDAILSAEVGGNEDAIFNYLQSGVDTYSDESIFNADISTSANIQSDKLNLTAISQSLANSGSTTLTGTFAANGTTNSIGNGGSDTLTLNVPGGMTLSAATTWTLTGALTFSGTIADLGTVTTADINGGTLDGVQVGGTTATGELIVNNSSDGADGLGSQGTSGDYLKSAGAGANPTWDIPTGFSNVLVSEIDISWTDEQSGTDGWQDIGLDWKWTKIINVNTLTFTVRASNDTAGGEDFSIRADIGAGTVVSNTLAVTSIETSNIWRTAFTADVSGLSDGTSYTIKLQHDVESVGSTTTTISGLMVEGS